MTPQNILQSLRDIDGVYGSFWVDFTGHIIARDVSAVVVSPHVARAGVCLAQLWQALASVEADELSSRFASHQLFFARLRHSTLCVFAALRVELATLRTATRVLRPWLEAHAPAGVGARLPA